MSSGKPSLLRKLMTRVVISGKSFVNCSLCLEQSVRYVPSPYRERARVRALGLVHLSVLRQRPLRRVTLQKRQK